MPLLQHLVTAPCLILHVQLRCVPPLYFLCVLPNLFERTLAAKRSALKISPKTSQLRTPAFVAPPQRPHKKAPISTESGNQQRVRP